MWLCLVAAVFLFGQMGAAQSKSIDKKKEIALRPPTWNVNKSLHDLGSTALALKGDGAHHKFYVGVRSDNVVTAAQLVLNYTASPSLLHRQSHLIIKLNDQLVGVLPVNGPGAESKQRQVVGLNPRLLVEDNWLSFTLVGHYTDVHCEDPSHSSIWLEVDPQMSLLQMQLAPLAIPDDLSFLPSPWMDRGDQNNIDVNIVTGATPDLPTLKAAAILASWLGSLNNRAPVRIHFWRDKLPMAHAIVLNATGKASQIPSARIANHPNTPNAKLLMLQGADSNALLRATQGLIWGKSALSGSTAEFDQPIELPPRRAAYDSPRWTPSHRVVTLGKLVNDPRALELISKHPASMRIQFPLAPDLWQGPGANAQLHLKYRAYSNDSEKEDSVMSVVVNGGLVQSARVPKADLAAHSALTGMASLWATQAEQELKVRLSHLRTGEDNQIELAFPLGVKGGSGLCASYLQASRASVHADSTLDLTELHHFKKMPDLKVLRNTGFPFTKYADLAETSFVLPATPEDTHIDAMLNVMSAMGRWSGVVADRVEVVTQDQATPTALKDRDLFVIGTGGLDALLREWASRLSIQNDPLEAAASDPTSLSWGRVFTRGLDWLGWGRVQVRVDGAMGLLGEFESPLTPGRTVAVLNGSDAKSLQAMTDMFIDPARSYRIEGGLVTLRGDLLTVLGAPDTYFVGHLPWTMRVGIWVSDHLGWVVLLVLSALGLLLIVVGRWLRAHARERLST